MQNPLRHVFTAGRWLRASLFAGSWVALLALAALLIWARQVIPAEPAARLALDSDESVAVRADNCWTFRPRDSDPVTGLVFYPGGRADPAAYAPMLRSIAIRGFLVVLCPMPLNLALLAPDRGASAFARNAEIRHWVVAGHSLGGVVAADFASRHVTSIAGLILWASYPSTSTNLADQVIPVLSIYGGADDLALPGDVEASARRLPPHTTFVAVPGADHWAFGHFGPGSGGDDDPDRAAHRAMIIDVTEDFLRKLGPPQPDPD